MFRSAMEASVSMWMKYNQSFLIRNDQNVDNDDTAIVFM
jgi:hypothetical protein